MDEIKNTVYQMFRFWLLLLIVTVTSILMFVTATITFFKANNVYRLYFVRPCVWVILKLYGLKVRIHNKENMSQEQCIYISNHRSSLDFFSLGTLGLKNTGYFISDLNKKYWPLRLIGICIGFFFIPHQGFPKERTLCFKEVEKVIRKTGDSVFLTPEGHKQPRYRLEKFNRGAFHMAANLKIPISPFYIHVPEQVNMGKGMQAKSGVIDIFFLKTIPTIDWEVKNVDKYKTDVHKIFLDFENNINETVSKL